MKYFIAIDGDNIGDIITKYFIENNKIKLKEFSASVEQSFQKIKQKFIDLEAEIIFCAGDSLLCEIDQKYVDKAINEIQKIDHFTISKGIGKNITKAYIALKYAKASGKNKVIMYDKI